VSTYVPGTTTLTYEDPTDTRVTLIIDQVKSFSFRLEDVNVAQMRPDALVDELSIRAAFKLRDTADTYIANLYTGATNTVATSQITAVNAYSKIVNLARLMDDADIPDEGRFLVVKPWIKELLLQNADFLRATEAVAKPAVLNGQIGTVAGIAILTADCSDVGLLSCSIDLPPDCGSFLSPLWYPSTPSYASRASPGSISTQHAVARGTRRTQALLLS
jgi:hypothetical protein